MSYEQARKGPVVYRWIAVALLVVILLTGVSSVRASVYITDFYAEAGENDIFLFWETASETGNLGFYVERSTSPDSGYERIEVMDTQGGYIGEFVATYFNGSHGDYEVIDINARLGTRYYYRLQDVPADGNSGVYTHPASAMIVLDWQVVLPMVYKQ